MDSLQHKWTMSNSKQTYFIKRCLNKLCFPSTDFISRSTLSSFGLGHFNLLIAVYIVSKAQQHSVNTCPPFWKFVSVAKHNRLVTSPSNLRGMLLIMQSNWTAVIFSTTWVTTWVMIACTTNQKWVPLRNSIYDWLGWQEDCVQ